MDHLDMETSSDSEEELIASLIDDDDDDDGVRYSLRTRRSSKTNPRKIVVSAATVAATQTSRNSDGTNERTTADVANPAGGSRVTEGRRHDVDGGSEERRRRMLIASAASPFELTSARGWMTGQRTRAPEQRVMDERMARSDPGAERTAGNPLRVRLPFEVDREDIPFVPACSTTTGAQTAAMMFATRMTAVEQARKRRDDVQRSAPTTIEGLPWTAYHALFEQRLRDGERALEKIADRRVETSSELNIHSDPRLLSVGGQRQDADRLDPVTEKCDNARAAGTGGGKTGQRNEAAGPRRDELHINMDVWSHFEG
jgi:hypothetical protein